MAKNPSRISEALEMLEDVASEYGDELKQLISDRYTRLRDVLRDYSPQVESAVKKAKNRVEDAFGSAREAGEQRAREFAKMIDGKFRQNVDERPWMIMGGVALAGFMLGFLFRRRK